MSGSDDKQVQPARSILRLTVMGTGPFAVPSFEALRQAGHPIQCVITRPQPPVKSRKGPPPAPVRKWAQQHDLPIDDPASINDPAAVDRLQAIGADLLVVCDYGQILKPAALAAARLGGINLHGSLLPAYRGAAPVQRALLSGDSITGVSVIHMTPRLDGGPILATRETAIRGDETAGELEQRLSVIGVDAVLEAVQVLAQWDGQSEIGDVQDPSRVSKAARLHKSEGEIDWSRSAREIDCQVRGMQPWPVAFTHVAARPDKSPIRIAVKEVAVLAASELSEMGEATPPESSSPGMLVSADRFILTTGDGSLEIRRLQPAGKREMSGEDFLRGHQLPIGTRLG